MANVRANARDSRKEPLSSKGTTLWWLSEQKKREAPSNSVYDLHETSEEGERLGVGGDGVQGMGLWFMPELSHLVFTGEEAPHTPQRY